jgi:hypothetical protein
MTSDTQENMVRLERIRGRIELLTDDSYMGVIRDDMIWMEDLLRRFLRAEAAQAKLFSTGSISIPCNTSLHNHPVTEHKVFERVNDMKDASPADRHDMLKSDMYDKLTTIPDNAMRTILEKNGCDAVGHKETAPS